jgi:hypothetical protein
MNLRYKRIPAILAVLALLAMASLACSFSTADFRSGSAQVDIRMDESEINTLLENSNNELDDDDLLLDSVSRIELQDGFVRVFGPYRQADRRVATGSYDVSFRAENGALLAEITGVDIEGASLDDARIQHMNEELAESLARSARQSKGEVEFEHVSISDETLSMQVNVRWDNR